MWCKPLLKHVFVHRVAPNLFVPSVTGRQHGVCVCGGVFACVQRCLCVGGRPLPSPPSRVMRKGPQAGPEWLHLCFNPLISAPCLFSPAVGMCVWSVGNNGSCYGYGSTFLAVLCPAVSCPADVGVLSSAFFLSTTHTLCFFLSVSLSHTRTHTLSLSVSIFSLSLSLSLTHTHTHTHTLFLSSSLSVQWERRRIWVFFGLCSVALAKTYFFLQFVGGMGETTEVSLDNHTKIKKESPVCALFSGMVHCTRWGRKEKFCNALLEQCSYLVQLWSFCWYSRQKSICIASCWNASVLHDMTKLPSQQQNEYRPLLDIG